MGLFDWLLLLAASLASFLLGRYWAGHLTPRARAAGNALSDIYVQGINYLLSEQPDEAIEAFDAMLASYPRNAETHLALGRLFRHRGEFERAIRVHKSLLDKQDLPPDAKYQALFELGRDYLKAGILDRAESVFREIVNQHAHDRTALHALADIYELEQDWPAAIEIRKRLAAFGDAQEQAVVALLYCELTEAALSGSDLKAASQHLAEAYAMDPDSPRGTLLAGKLAMAAGRCDQALAMWEALLERSPMHFTLILDEFLQSAERAGQQELKTKALYHLAGTLRAPHLVAQVARHLAAEEGGAVALDYLRHVLTRRPQLQGLQAFVEIATRTQGLDPEACRTLADAVARLPAEPSRFYCTVCGFHSQAHYWKCPGCRRWDTIKAVQEHDNHA